MRFYEAERLGPNQSTTPEGFLICKDVPVAKIGDLVYAAGELPLEAGPDGLIRVSRTSEDLFSPTFMASLIGKPVVDMLSVGQGAGGDHPSEDVTPDDWADLASGSIISVRQGDAPMNDCLLADLLITRRKAIDAVRSGKRGVSLGYNAEYTQTAPGRGLQKPVSANHVAMTNSPRCGPRCSIGDSTMTKKIVRTSTAASRDSFLARMRKAFMTKDADEFEAALEDGAIMAGSGDGEDEGDKGGAVHVHVYGNGDKPPKPEGATDAGGVPPKPEGEGGKKPDAADPMAPVLEAIKGIGDRLTALETKVNGDGGTGDAAETDEEKAAREAAEAKAKEEKEGKTGDSAALAAGWQDTVARAEILAPGIKIPTFDAKAKRGATIDAMCGFRRAALDKFGASDDGKSVLAAMDIADTKGLSCDTIGIAFRVASDAKKAKNNGVTYMAGGRTYDSAARKGPPTPAEMNEIHRKHYAKKG